MESSTMSEPQSQLLDALWKMYLEHCTTVRHHETQRSSVAAAFVAIAAALVGLITFDKEITPRDLPSALFLLGLGLFGAAFCAKQWERACNHAEKARCFRIEIDATLGGTRIHDLKHQAEKAHDGKFPRLHRMRLHRFWVGLYLAIALLGGVLSLLTLFGHDAPSRTGPEISASTKAQSSPTPLPSLSSPP
jgi:hypothetical protein